MTLISKDIGYLCFKSKIIHCKTTKINHQTLVNIYYTLKPFFAKGEKSKPPNKTNAQCAYVP